MTAHILVVDDDPPMRRLLAAELEFLGYQTTVAARVDEARRQLADRPFQLVLTDLILPDGDGLDVLATSLERQPGIPVVLLSGRGTIDHAVSAIKRGATDFLQKPVDPARLADVVTRSLVASTRASGPSRHESARAIGIVGESAALRVLLDRVTQVAATDTTVLLQGESGTGKELIARALHEGSDRRGKAFVALDCGALDSNLLASELFGHVRGAFTGAEATRQGLFQAAHGGTLFLDEIGNLSLELQSRLLRVLQERRVRPVGGDSEREVDVRVIAATNRDLRSSVATNGFRQDLYYRLAVVTLHLPPLRERPTDVPLLAHHFSDAVTRRLGLPPVTFGAHALERLVRYPWPGNVRELANVVERAVVLARSQRGAGPWFIRDVELPDPVGSGQGTVELLDEAVRRAEEQAIRRALKYSSSKAEAARRLGISRRALYDKLDKLAIHD